MPKRLPRHVGERLNEATETIIGLCNAVLLRGTTPITAAQLHQGILGGSRSYLRAVVFRALVGDPNEEELLLANVAINMATWQAIMRGIVKEPVLARIIRNAGIHSSLGRDRAITDIKRHIVADALAIRIGTELYTHPHDHTYIHAPDPVVRRSHMLQSLTALAQLVAKQSQKDEWICVRLVAELQSWEKNIGKKTVKELCTPLQGGLQKAHLRAARQLVEFACNDTEVSFPIYENATATEESTQTDLSAPAEEPSKFLLH